MKYFTDCTTIDEVKALYKKLALQHHPDRGGDNATMQIINEEYRYACAHITKDAGLSGEQADEQIRLSEEYQHVISAIIHLPGIVIEVVANWIWVSKDTYPVRRELKAAGLFFASKKQVWYYRNEAFKTRGNGASLDEIRAKYGSETIHGKRNNKILED
jgi:hypothetical protein